MLSNEILEKVFGYILILFVEAVIIVGSYQKGENNEKC